MADGTTATECLYEVLATVVLRDLMTLASNMPDRGYQTRTATRASPPRGSRVGSFVNRGQGHTDRDDSVGLVG